MAWNIIRNFEPASLKEQYSGICPESGKTAEVTVHYVGSKLCKTDLQKTYRKSGVICSLLQKTDKAGFSPCMDHCPLVPKKY